MRLLDSEREQVQRVADRWKQQYCHGGDWGSLLRGSSHAIYTKLAALPSTATAADVAAIIGNDGWIGEDCDECGEHTAIVLLGDEPDHESHTVYLCADCVRRVQQLIESPQSVDAVDPHAGVTTE